MFRNVLSFIAVCIISASASFADDWVLAAMKFDFVQNVSHSSLEEKAAEDLPSLILEKIGLGSSHLLSFNEQIDSELYDLQTKRLSLFLQLSREVKIRDELVLQENNIKKLKKKISEQDEKIKQLEMQIKENLAMAESKNSILPSDSMPAVMKTVALYEKDTKRLYSIDDIDKLDIDIIDKNINGLITGSITSYGEYAAVSVELKSYPGSRTIGSVVEVGSIYDLNDLAVNISNSLKPLIANSIPINLFIAIEPENAKSSAKVFIDGVMQDDIDILKTTYGEHTIEVESAGYFTKHIVYNFTDSTDFQIRFPMEKIQNGTFSLTLSGVNDGSNFINAEPFGYLDKLNNTSTVTINGNSVIGHVASKTEEGKSIDSYYYIPEELQKNDSKYAVNLKSVDRDSVIEERRLWSYRGYSALMLSLPLTVFAYGRYLSANEGYSRGAESADTMNSWAYASRMASGVSLIAGGFFLFELVRYLHSASSVLPQHAYDITNEKSEE